MNKFLLLATTLCLAATSLQAQTETITMEKAGTLDSIVDARNVRYTTTSLTVSGPINGKDFVTLRDMCGVKNYTTKTDGQVTSLDLSGARIVASDDVYFNYMGTSYTTKDDDFSSFLLYCCRNLKSLSLPQGIKSMGEMALASCSSLEGITIPSTVESIGRGCFVTCNSITHLDIPDAVTSLGLGAFQQMAGLTSISFGSGVTVLPNSPFLQDGMLESIHFGSGFATFSPYDVYGLEALKTITVDDANPSFAAQDGVLFNKDLSTLACYPVAQPGEEYAVPATVKTVGVMAFQSAANLKKVSLPSSVERLDSLAFMGCKLLRDVEFSEGLKTICQGAFGANLDEIGSLTTLTLPASVSEIQGGAFYNNAALTSVVVNPENAYYTNSEEGYLYTKDLQTLVYVPAATAVDSFYVNKGVKTVAPFAFSCCGKIKGITLSDDVDSIGDYAFFCDSTLQKLTLGNAIKKVGAAVVDYCSQLTSVYLYTPAIDDSGLNEYAFFDEAGSVMSQATLYVPAGTAEYYLQKKGFYIALGEGEEAEVYPFFADYQELSSTGVSKPETATLPSATKCYNLAGQQVGKNYKGIVIENGKKRFVR